MKENRIIINIVFIVSAMMWMTSCEEDERPNVTAELSGGGTIIQGDSTDLTVDLTGTPPFAFMYNDGAKDVTVLGIEDYSYTLRVAPNDTTVYTAVAAATYGGKGMASGSATVNVKPAVYVSDQSVSPSKDGYIQKSVNALNLTVAELQVRTQNTNWARTAYVEFDASEITNAGDKNKYQFTFWLTASHAQGVSAGPGVMEVKGIVGALDESMTWDSQPSEGELTALFTGAFNPETAETQVEFSGDITSIVNDALANPNSNKFTLRIMEKINGVGNGGFYYVGSSTYPEESKRPALEVFVREE